MNFWKSYGRLSGAERTDCLHAEFETWYVQYWNVMIIIYRLHRTWWANTIKTTQVLKSTTNLSIQVTCVYVGNKCTDQKQLTATLIWFKSQQAKSNCTLYRYQSDVFAGYSVRARRCPIPLKVGSPHNSIGNHYNILFPRWLLLYSLNDFMSTVWTSRMVIPSSTWIYHVYLVRNLASSHARQLFFVYPNAILIASLLLC